jgi:GNAT superfamily N-acetyltransferase
MNASVPSIVYEEGLPAPGPYLALFETTGWNEMYRCSADELESALRRSWYAISAYREGVLVGFGRLVSDGVLYAVVFDMVVAPDLQRRGIGSEILNRLLARCADAGIRDVLLFAARGTESFYRGHGFTARPADAPGMILRRVRTEAS